MTFMAMDFPMPLVREGSIVHKGALMTPHPETGRLVDLFYGPDESLLRRLREGGKVELNEAGAFVCLGW